ncbi:hypothetical protein [Gillisia hiemivivida]|uniref:Uncharacterized protein n=1 Tax=Gillisia hiemivivida TaxID=291190 RepID=A0A5C6ZZS7_9FLAO|nr:hypothetical protein [Gillisia hiemivivida]TXD94913.1 hypothetical protein ES724_05445 [Gillisia hiemivivida]
MNDKYNNIISVNTSKNDNTIQLEYNSIIKNIYDNKFQKWFKLKDIVKLKNISYRSLKGMVAKVYNKYNDQGLIYRKGRRYYISYRILDSFKLEKPRKKRTIYDYEWKTNVSWTTLDFYDLEYHTTLFDEVKTTLSDVHFIGCVESDASGKNHVHILADHDTKYLRKPLKKILDQYLDDTRHYRLYCEQVNNIGGSVDYLMKNPQKLIN